MRMCQFKKYIVIAILLVAPLEASACGFFTGLFTSEEVSIEYAGEIAFGEVKTENTVTTIPISFSGGKWIYNSGVAFKKVKSKVANDQINITVVTCVASGGSGPHPRKEITLKDISQGLYQINYVNPDGSVVPLGKIEI